MKFCGKFGYGAAVAKFVYEGCKRQNISVYTNTEEEKISGGIKSGEHADKRGKE